MWPDFNKLLALLADEQVQELRDVLRHNQGSNVETLALMHRTAARMALDGELTRRAATAPKR